MESVVLASAVAVLTFGFGVLGLKLRVWLPEKHGADRSRDMIGSMTGLLGLLLALVLGTLIGGQLYALLDPEIRTRDAGCALDST